MWHTYYDVQWFGRNRYPSRDFLSPQIWKQFIIMTLNKQNNAQLCGMISWQLLMNNKDSLKIHPQRRECEDNNFIWIIIVTYYLIIYYHIKLLYKYSFSFEYAAQVPLCNFKWPFFSDSVVSSSRRIPYGELSIWVTARVELDSNPPMLLHDNLLMGMLGQSMANKSTMKNTLQLKQFCDETPYRQYAIQWIKRVTFLAVIYPLTFCWQTMTTFGQSSETRDLSIHLLDKFLLECLRRNAKSLSNINLTLYGATISMVVASKLLERHHLSYVRFNHWYVNM